MRKLPLAIFGLALLSTSEAPAGTTGNGWNNGNAATPGANLQYSYCFGRRSQTVYFSAVITSPQSTTGSNLPVDFGNYLTKTFGAGSDNGSCQTFLSMNAAVADKTQREAKFNPANWKVVETNWTGAGAPGAASSPATSPAASANTGTSAQAVPGAGRCASQWTDRTGRTNVAQQAVSALIDRPTMQAG